MVLGQLVIHCWMPPDASIYPGIIAVASQAVATATIPTFVNAGAGSGTLDPLVALTPGAPAGIANGDWLIAQVALRSGAVTGIDVLDASWLGGWAYP